MNLPGWGQKVLLLAIITVPWHSIEFEMKSTVYLYTFYNFHNESSYVGGSIRGLKVEYVKRVGARSPH